MPALLTYLPSNFFFFSKLFPVCISTFCSNCLSHVSVRNKPTIATFTHTRSLVYLLMFIQFITQELLNLGAEEILQRQVEELEKERKELQQRLKAQEKKVDYFERAKRLVEIPLLKKMLEDEKVSNTISNLSCITFLNSICPLH